MTEKLDMARSSTDNQAALTVSIVVPCYNEASRLDLPAFRSFLSAEPSAQLVMVNDGSTDGTLELLHRFAAESPDRVTVVDVQPNSGKAEAVRRGILAAAPRSSFVAFWDADLATPLCEVDRFQRRFELNPALAMVIGSRVKLMGRRIERRVSRHYVGRVAATAISNVLGLAVYDTQCGAKMFRVDDRLQRVFSTPFITRWLFDVEVIARYRDEYDRAGEDVRNAIYELPLKEWRDVAGSKVKFRDFIRSGTDLLKIRSAYRRKR
jgi:dolichyl-phosphate beta-glucosyltransferase